MGEPDGSTAEFDGAVTDFTAASEKVYGLRMGAYQLRARAEVVDAEIREREREVAGSEVVQAAPAEGAHNAETRAARVIAILLSDGEHIARRQEANDLRGNIAQNDAELERARDQRSVAKRRMDFAIAVAETPARAAVRLSRCENETCGEIFVKHDLRMRYCSTRCADTQRKRDSRRAKDTAKENDDA